MERRDCKERNTRRKEKKGEKNEGRRRCKVEGREVRVSRERKNRRVTEEEEEGKVRGRKELKGETFM